MTVTETATIPGMPEHGSKSLPEPEQRRVREALRRLVESEGGSQTAAAKRLGITQQTVSQVLGGDSPGVKMARAIAAAMQVPLDELLSGQRRETTVHYDSTRPILGAMPGYAEAEALARTMAPRLPESAWEAARKTSGADLRRVDAATVLGFAQLWASAAGQVQPYPDDGDVPPPPRKR